MQFGGKILTVLIWNLVLISLVKFYVLVQEFHSLISHGDYAYQPINTCLDLKNWLASIGFVNISANCFFVST